MMRPIVFMAATGRPDGATQMAVQLALEGYEYDIIDLATKNFSDYDPTHKNSDDDFMEMAEQMSQHNPIILACPVFWYNVPALMKRFIDRWGDLLEGRKDIARKLSGKKLMVIAPYGTYPGGNRGFEEPLKYTAEYMDMHYQGCYFQNHNEVSKHHPHLYNCH